MCIRDRTRIVATTIATPSTRFDGWILEMSPPVVSHVSKVSTAPIGQSASTDADASVVWCRTAATMMNTANAIWAVSYTHLDVYKRKRFWRWWAECWR